MAELARSKKIINNLSIIADAHLVKINTIKLKYLSQIEDQNGDALFESVVEILGRIQYTWIIATKGKKVFKVRWLDAVDHLMKQEIAKLSKSELERINQHDVWHNISEYLYKRINQIFED